MQSVATAPAPATKSPSAWVFPPVTVNGVNLPGWSLPKWNPGPPAPPLGPAPAMSRPQVVLLALQAAHLLISGTSSETGNTRSLLSKQDGVDPEVAAAPDLTCRPPACDALTRKAVTP